MSEFTTENLTMKSTERFSFGYNNFRAINGSGESITWRLTLAQILPQTHPLWWVFYASELSRAKSARGVE